MKMPKALKTKWVKALRSGKYKQGKYELYIPREGKAPPRFCCLGVLEHCAMNGKVESLDNGEHVEFKALPSAAFYKKFGITKVHSGMFNERAATRMNDTYEYTFDQIADEIEKYVETY